MPLVPVTPIIFSFSAGSPKNRADISAKAKWLAEGMRSVASKAGVPVAVNQIGSLLSPFFTPTEVTAFVDAKGSDVGRYARYFKGMLERGVNLAPAQFEAMFVSAAHSQAELDASLEAAEAVFPTL